LRAAFVLNRFANIDLHKLIDDEFFLFLISAAVSQNIAPSVVILSSGGEG